MTADRLAALLDQHWLEQEVDGDPAIAACSCGEWRFDARTCGLTVLQMGEHFYPFSEHIAARLEAAGVTVAPQPAPDALRAAAQAVVDRYAGIGHFSDCYPVGPCTCGMDALRAALGDEP